MDYISQFIRPELLILVPVLYIIGAGAKKSRAVADNRIPLLLGAVGVLLAVVYVLAACRFTGWQSCLMAVFTAFTQGILCAGASVYVHQLIKQAGEK